MKTLLFCLAFLACGAGMGVGAALLLPAQTPLIVSAPPDLPVIYVDLPQQFVVPVVEQGNVAAMVVLTLSIASRQGDEDRIRSAEPRLRDQFLQVLFQHANAGKFAGAFTAAAVLGELRQGLLVAARDTVGPAAQDVLIIDILRQDN